jgi:biopolymer transport protein ExbD
MQLGSQTLGPKDFNRHLVARAHRKGARRRQLLIGLSLTSMVDMFSLLVIFLLQAFSASPELIVLAKDVQLPVASTGAELKDAPVLALSNEKVYLDQKEVGSTLALLRDPQPLLVKLRELRERWMKTHPDESFRGEIHVQADRGLSSATVSQFMGFLPSQNYGSIQLAVIGGSSR